MSVLGVVVPTVPGRETELERCLASLRVPAPELGLAIVSVVIAGYPTCGEAWNAGAELLFDDFGDELDWLMFTADDLIADERWAYAALRRATNGRRELPTPQLFLEDGRRDPRANDGPDGVAADFPRVPFLPAADWKTIGPIPPLHYFSDVLIGERLRELGYGFRVTAGFAFVHLWSAPGRIHDDGPDRRLYEEVRSRA